MDLIWMVRHQNEIIGTNFKSTNFEDRILNESSM